MPKMKTHSGAKKRFRVTGSGKIMHERAGKRHLLALGFAPPAEIANLRSIAK